VLKEQLLIASTLTRRVVALAFLLSALTLSAESDSLESVVAKMERAADEQRRHLCSYSVDRRYEINNDDLPSPAVMTVHLSYQIGKGKQFDRVQIQGANVLVKRALLNLLREESDASKQNGEAHRVDSTNYTFDLLGTETVKGRHCLLVQLKPRKRSKYLIEGTAWVDTDTYGVIKVQGVLADKPSFWVHRPEVTQLFEKYDQFWLPSYNVSKAKVTFVGDTKLTIQYTNYEVSACPPKR
jgi:hypothetical protein